MILTLMSSPSFLTFLLASLLLALAPGPGVMYLLTRTLSLGRAAGLASVGGVAIGNLANAALASLGLAALMAASALAFTVVKFVGAVYLVFLAVQTLRAKPEAPGASGTAAGSAASSPTARGRALGPSAARIFRDGFLVALLNPKTALFFAALLPQFIVPGIAPLPQTLFLGLVFVAVAMCTDTLYVCAAAAFAQQLQRHAGVRGVGRYLAAATFVGLAAYAAFANPRATR